MFLNKKKKGDNPWNFNRLIKRQTVPLPSLQNGQVTKSNRTYTLREFPERFAKDRIRLHELSPFSKGQSICVFQGREIVEGFFSWWIKSNDSYVEARCLDVLMMLKDQVLLSFIQDKNPRKSRYMIKLISRIFRKKFPYWKQTKGLTKEFYHFKLRFALW